MCSIKRNVVTAISSIDAMSGVPDLNLDVEQQSSNTQMQKYPRRELFRRSKRIRERRATESAEVRLKRLHINAQRHRFRRQEETQVEKERRRPKDTQHQRKHRRQKSAMPALEMRNEDVVNSYLGKMDNTCRHCGALHFKNEILSGEKEEYKQCCHYGSMELPALLRYPEEIKILLQGTDSEGRDFRENIRSYNNVIAFASMDADIVSPSNNGPYCFRIHGQIYHRIGPLHPELGQSAQ
jgi:hypothetical protein